MSDANGTHGANGSANGVNPEKDLAASNLPGQRGQGGEEIRVQRGMFGGRAPAAPPPHRARGATRPRPA
ncbi:hypothetical protein ACFW7O_35325, partial [Streptomyces diastatochromogenes]